MIDSHAHVALAQFDDDREAVILRARRAGVRWVEVATDIAGSRAALALAQAYPEDVLGATVGVHPSEVNSNGVDWVAAVQMLDHPRVVAVGEVGFDFYRGGQAAVQMPVLEQFVDLAVARSLPVIFHVRSSATADAHAELLSFLRKLPAARRPRGAVHTFSGSLAQAEEFLSLGLYLSISGVVTFRNAGAMADVAQTMPLDRLLVETDCPFLAPEPHRGKRNEPAYVQLVLQRAASLRDVAVEAVQRATAENVRQLMRLEK